MEKKRHSSSSSTLGVGWLLDHGMETKPIMGNADPQEQPWDWTVRRAEKGSLDARKPHNKMHEINSYRESVKKGGVGVGKAEGRFERRLQKVKDSKTGSDAPNITNTAVCSAPCRPQPRHMGSPHCVSWLQLRDCFSG